MNDLEKKIFDKTAYLITEEQMELISVELVKEFGSLILRYTIDKEGGIAIEDTTKISEKLDPVLDQLDPIEGEYYLEVSSVGLEKELRSLEEITKNIGKYVNIKTYEKIEVGKTFEKEIEGTLISCIDENLTLNVKIKQFKKEITIPYKKIAKIRLAIEF